MTVYCWLLCSCPPTCGCHWHFGCGIMLLSGSIAPLRMTWFDTSVPPCTILFCVANVSIGHSFGFIGAVCCSVRSVVYPEWVARSVFARLMGLSLPPFRFDLIGSTRPSCVHLSKPDLTPLRSVLSGVGSCGDLHAECIVKELHVIFVIYVFHPVRVVA